MKAAVNYMSCTVLSDALRTLITVPAFCAARLVTAIMSGESINAVQQLLLFNFSVGCPCGQVNVCDGPVRGQGCP